ncbi:MAG TPA: ribonuclease T [Sphingomonas sp.]
MIRASLIVAAFTLPGIAHAQALRCAVPTGPQRVRPDLASASQPKRVVPIGGYTLALTWNPQYCRGKARDRSAAFQCGEGNSFGFTLHGLWPDGEGKEWPQYCRTTGLIPQPVIRGALCATPSAQLLQHEWAKHGTCMAGESPASYFRRATGLYGRVRYPDMDRLSRGMLTAGRLAKAIADANPGLSPQMMRITTSRGGWLDELWLCLDRRFRYARCPAHQGGVAPSTPIKVWRGRR